MISYLSASSINTYYSCPRKFLYQLYHLPQIAIDSEARDRGTLVHSLIKNYFTIGEYAKLEDKTCKMLMSNFEDAVKILELKNPELVEAKLSSSIDAIKIIGIVDFYSKGMIIDWKTGREAKGIDQQIRTQAEIYRYLLRSSGFEVNKVLFVYLKSLKIVEIPPETEDFLRKRIEPIEKDVAFGKHESALCAWCEYQIRCSFENRSAADLIGGVLW